MFSLLAIYHQARIQRPLGPVVEAEITLINQSLKDETGASRVPHGPSLSPHSALPDDLLRRPHPALECTGHRPLQHLRLLDAFPIGRAQLPLVHLPHRVAADVRPELDAARTLVVRQPVATERDQRSEVLLGVDQQRRERAQAPPVGNALRSLEMPPSGRSSSYPSKASPRNSTSPTRSRRPAPWWSIRSLRDCGN